MVGAYASSRYQAYWSGGSRRGVEAKPDSTKRSPRVYDPDSEATSKVVKCLVVPSVCKEVRAANTFHSGQRSTQWFSMVLRGCAKVRLMLVAKSMTGEEVARQLIATLSTDLSVPANHIVAFMQGRASVNNVDMRTVSILYNSMIDIGCFSHTLDRVGENMNTPILDEHWIS